MTTDGDGDDSNTHDVTSALEYWPSPPPWGWTADDLDQMDVKLGHRMRPCPDVLVIDAAEAGIAHFWRVEESDGKPVVYVYELDPATRTYAVTGIHRGKLGVSVPFSIDIDLDAMPR
jgi:hypothetical protein